MSEYTIDPNIWFGNRKLDYEPLHFTRATTSLTPQSLEWLIKNLKGRYYIASNIDFEAALKTDFYFGEGFGNAAVPSFEDPSEAMFYELTWS